VGGSVALSFAWGTKHLLWGIVVLLTAIIVTVLEGSYLETKCLDQRRSNELAGQRDKHQAEVERLQSEHQGELNRALTAAIAGNRQDQPEIKLKIVTIHYKDRNPALRVNVTNVGSSAVAITSIFMWAKWQGGGRSGRGFDYLLADEGQHVGIEGPPLPFKLDGYDSRNWDFDPEWTGLSLKESINGGTREIITEVRMATGESVEETIKIDDRFSSDEILYLSSNHMPEG
jgi:hypothetical protein